MTTLTAKRNTAAAAEDIGNIVSLEHVNVRIDDQSLATLFYIIGLGFTRDPYMNVGLTNMWINIGDQQFHLPTGQPQVLRGHTGLVVPDIAALKERLASVEGQLQGTQFAWSDTGEHVEARSPWGNVYRIYPAGSFGQMQLGVPYVELSVPRGSAPSIQRFYAEVFEAPGEVEDGIASIEVGIGQTLRFRESDDIAEYDGHHIAIYIANFSGPYSYLQERGLVTEEIRNHQFRFQDIVEPSTGERVFVLEHEAQEAVLEACRTADLELPKVADRHSNEIALGQLSLAQLTEQHRHERQVGDLQPGSASVSASAWVSTLVLARFVEPRKVVDYSDYGPTRMAISTYRGS